MPRPSILTWNVSFVFTAISTNRHGKTPGSKPSSYKIQPAPYHDWNERITAECYAPNSVSRILDGQGRIVKLVNNYAKMSFDFGPTLLSWLEVKAPNVYATILAADRESQKYFSGHGSAIAQAYNHVIMPLANSRDRATQIIWGVRDFEKRFNRAPEGMWLPETAVDLETLEFSPSLACVLRFWRRIRRRACAGSAR